MQKIGFQNSIEVCFLVPLNKGMGRGEFNLWLQAQKEPQKEPQKDEVLYKFWTLAASVPDNMKPLGAQ